VSLATERPAYGASEGTSGTNGTRGKRNAKGEEPKGLGRRLTEGYSIVHSHTTWGQLTVVGRTIPSNYILAENAA
jgi:hypothetical protein